jgi:SNF2 family DNA or RNA helicase
MNLGSVACRVQTADRMDRLLVRPASPDELYALAGRLRSALPDVRLDGRAVAVLAAHAGALLDGVPGIQLEWTESAGRFAANRRRARLVHARVRDEVERIKAGGAAVASECLRDLDDAGILDAHQRVNVAAMTVAGSPGLAVFDEQGAGKTVTLIFGFDLLVKRREADLALVIAPKSMVPEWPRDLARFKSDLYRSAVLSGSRREKIASLRRGADFYVTNFETAISLEDELTALLRARDGRAILAIDESFFVKNLDAKRTQAVRRLREWCDRAFVLCGTPAPNRPHDLIEQFNIVDLGITFDGIDVPEAPDEAVPVVQAAVDARGLSVRHLKRDVLPNLPGKAFERVLVPLQPLQKRLYDGALRNLLLDVQSTNEAAFQKQIASFLARRMALLQICSHPSMVADAYAETPAKLIALDAIVEDLVERRGEKVIIWSFFRHSVEAITQRFERFGAVRYDGSVGSVDERRDAVRRFQEDDVTRVFVGNPAAAGAGLTLHRARIAIYESQSNQAAHYLQSLDRIHRRGQEREVEYLVLLADGTIELDEYERLLAKERTAQALLGDHVDAPPMRERMLHELTIAAARAGIPMG